MRVRLTCNVWLHGVFRPSGAELDLPDDVASDLILACRAEGIPQAGEVTTAIPVTVTQEPKSGKKSRKKS